jgi:threonine dehydrogenase-like Zn-dependent dehydrogenase
VALWAEWECHYQAIPGSEPAFYRNITVSGGPAPVRAYFEELLPDILEGRIQPGRVFDRTIGLNEVPDGYRAMDERKSIKVMVKP